jgi:hypothetical protein
MRFGRGSGGGEDKPGTDWQTKAREAGRDAKEPGTEHDRRAPLTDDEVLGLIEGKNKDEE